MKRFLTYIAVMTLFCSGAGSALAEDIGTHSVYKVTTYNLGTIVDFQGSANVNVRDYEPLLITSTKADILNSDQNKTMALETAVQPNSTRGFVIAAEYNATPQLALQGTFGMTKNSWDPSLNEHDSSWEANLSVIYRLLNNLNYEVHFGYMDPGDLFKERNSYSDVESIIMISNKLTMSF